MDAGPGGVRSVLAEHRPGGQRPEGSPVFWPRWPNTGDPDSRRAKRRAEERGRRFARRRPLGQARRRSAAEFDFGEPSMPLAGRVYERLDATGARTAGVPGDGVVAFVRRAVGAAALGLRRAVGRFAIVRRFAAFAVGAVRFSRCLSTCVGRGVLRVDVAYIGFVSWVFVFWLVRCVMPSLITPPGADVIPARDQDLVAFGQAFGAAFGIAPFSNLEPPGADIVDAAVDFSTRLDIASNPSTRTSVTIANKNSVRRALVSLLRVGSRNAQTLFRAGGCTESQLNTLGLRSPDAPSPIAAPTDAPLVDVVSVAVDTVQLRVNQVVNGAPVTLRRFPYGVVGVEWTFISGTTSRVFSSNRVNVIAPTTEFANGAIVRVCGRYYTRRGLVGPMCQEVTFPVLRGGE